MRPISWLHISDIHMNEREAWPQNVVLQAMCKQIKNSRAQGLSADFILVTGDLAFAGKADEYDLVAKFLDALCTASGVPKERMFCIPGNHDINRNRQKFCFLGARTELQDHSRVGAVLDGGDDLKALLKRQENYRQFQKEFFSNQDRTSTADGLGYVSGLTIDDVRLAIIGLDSAWLAQGGNEDHGKLLIGERQILNALQLVKEYNEPAHIIIAMAHHPFHLLQNFDHRTAMTWLEESCHFMHCGHLHEPEERTMGAGGTGCLSLATGASYETRQSHNSYSLVTLDLLRAERVVTIFQYDPAANSFSSHSPNKYPIEITSVDMCSVTELASAMEAFDRRLSRWAHYLSALLLGRKSEVPIPVEMGYSFASFTALQALDDSDLKHKTFDFMTFRNVLQVLYKQVNLSEIFAQHGAIVTAYNAILCDICNADSTLASRLDDQESDARSLVDMSTVDTPTTFAYTSALLKELADEQDWYILRDQAQRHVDSSDETIAVLSKRFLALSLAHLDEPGNNEAAIEIYRALVNANSREFMDTIYLARLLIHSGDCDEAKAVVLKGLGKFPAKSEVFWGIGQEIVAVTGDRNFREKLDVAIRERDNSD